MNIDESRKPKLLIVDDSPTQLLKLRKLVENNGFDVEQASNGEDALACARNYEPDVIISDIFMPKMNGYELCQAIKLDPKLKSIPVILLTTMSAAESIVEAINSGADYFIPKPYDDKYLIAKIKYVLATMYLNTGYSEKETMEIVVDGKHHVVTSNRQQILNLLLSTYDAVVQKNKELYETQVKLRETQQQLIESQRLAAIAEVVSTICHEINNPLAAVMVHLQSYLRHDLQENYKKDFKQWLEMLNRIAASVKKLAELKTSKTTSVGGVFKMIDLSSNEGNTHDGNYMDEDQ